MMYGMLPLQSHYSAVKCSVGTVFESSILSRSKRNKGSIRMRREVYGCTRRARTRLVVEITGCTRRGELRMYW